MELRNKIAEIFRDSWETPEAYADSILALPEFKRLELWEELVEALEEVSKLSTAHFDEAYDILRKIREVLSKALEVKNG